VLLEVEGDDEQLAVEAEVEQQADGGRGGELAGGEHPEGEHRACRPVLEVDEHRAGDEEGGEAAEDHGSAPAGGPGVDEGDGEPGQRCAGGGLAGGVGTVGSACHRGQDPGGEQESGDTDRDVHEEHAAPPEC
jgi:hypothetical protein